MEVQMERLRKHSKKRDAILECIAGTKCHPTAEWVYQQLKPDFPDLSLGTVYRNISMFKEEGVIQSIGVVNGLERFDFNTEPHTHFICTVCGQVLDLENVALPAAVLEDAASGGIITSYQLLFTGTCAQCTEHARKTIN